jgi:hypothetical protein
MVLPPKPPVDPGTFQPRTLLQDIWRTAEATRFIGVLDRQTGQFRNISVKSLDEAETLAVEYSTQGFDVYIALAEYINESGRKAHNVAQVWALWVDLDCGPEKAASGQGYASVAEAETVTQHFCLEAGIPAPTHIVHSGSGVHSYWVTDVAFTPSEWKETAVKFKAVAKALGFLADPSRTSDIASVLRFPGTLNHKSTPGKPVTLTFVAESFIAKSELAAAVNAAFDKFCQGAESPVVKSQREATAATADYGPPNMEQLKSALTAINLDSCEKNWSLRIVAPLARAASAYPEMAEELNQLAIRWSSGELRGLPSKEWSTPGGNGRTGVEFFPAVWQRFLSEPVPDNGTGLGSIFHLAKQAGWQSPGRFQVIAEGQTETLSREEAVLLFLQELFALINLEGKIYVIDKRTLEKSHQNKITAPLVLSNFRDGKLLMLREIHSARVTMSIGAN